MITEDQIKETIESVSAALKMKELFEGKSPLLNACEKRFGAEVVYSMEPAFEVTVENMRALFEIIDASVFNRKLSRLPDMQLYVGSPSELNPIFAQYTGNPRADISASLASYAPNVSRKYVERKGVAGPDDQPYEVILTKNRDAIFVNTDLRDIVTLAYAVSTLCHEMIHCFDFNFGALKAKTEFLLGKKGVTSEVIDYTSHFTQVFKQKSEIMLKTHGIKIRVQGDSIPMEELMAADAENIQQLREDDGREVLVPYDYPDEVLERTKGFLYKGRIPGEYTFVFSQKRYDSPCRKGE